MDLVDTYRGGTERRESGPTNALSFRSRTRSGVNPSERAGAGFSPDKIPRRRDPAPLPPLVLARPAAPFEV